MSTPKMLLDDGRKRPSPEVTVFDQQLLMQLLLR
jgi:hypothetical protein